MARDIRRGTERRGRRCWCSRPGTFAVNRSYAMKRPSFLWSCLTVLTVVLPGGPPDTAASEPSAEPVYQVASPVGESTAKATAMAPRLATLAGKTVGLVGNRSFKADVTLPAIAVALKKRYPGIKI